MIMIKNKKNYLKLFLIQNKIYVIFREFSGKFHILYYLQFELYPKYH